MTLYPCTGAETGSQDSLNRVYHSSDTLRFLGLNRPTGRERAQVRSPDLRNLMISVVILWISGDLS